MAVVSPGATVTDLAAVYTTTGGVIIDATRQAALAWTATQAGGSTDDLTIPAGVGVWEAGTNLHPHGQCDTNGNYTAAGVAGSSIGAPDTGTPFTITPQTIPVVCDGTGAFQGVAAFSNSGIAAAAGTLTCGSIRFKGVAGHSYGVFTSWQNTDASLTNGVITTFTATGAEQLITAAPTAVAAGKTGDIARIVVQTNAAEADTFHVGCPMLQSGVSVISPYIATSGGNTQSRTAGRVSAPSALLSSAAGFVVCRLLMGWAAATGAFGGAGFPGVFDWRTDPSNRISLSYNEALTAWSTDAVAAGVFNSAVSAAQTFVRGDSVTVACAWDATTIYVSAAGAAWTTHARGTVIAPSGVTFDLANRGGTPIDSALAWAIVGQGVPSSNDLAAIAALPDATPAAFLPVADDTTGRLFTYAPVGPKFRRVRVGEPVVTAR